MLVFRRSPFYGLCMVVGALLIGIAGLYHPVLTGDGAATLKRFEASHQPEAKRRQVEFTLTHEVLAKLASDVTAV